MSPGPIIAATLAVLRVVVGGMPSEAAGIIGDIVDALDGLPDLVDAIGDGEWTGDDVDALRDAVAALLDEVPGVPTWHARRIAAGIAAATALIVAAARKEPPARVRKQRERSSKALSTLRAALAGRAVEP